MPSPAEIVSGYLGGFDPDFVVPVGKCSKRIFDIGNRELIATDQLVGNISDSYAPRYGIGLVEVLEDFIEKELKYKRNDKLHIAFPVFPRAYRLFLSSIFGALPIEAKKIADRYCESVAEVSKVEVKLNNFSSLLRPERLFPRHLSSWSLEGRPFRDPVLFICDATKSLDIIDFWNLRSAGHQVVPVPVQAINNDSVQKLAREFINTNYRPYRHNAAMFHVTTVQISRNMDAETAQEFCKSLNIDEGEQSNSPKYLLRWWYPRLWDPWAREHASENIEFPYSHEEEREVSEGDVTLNLRSIDPKIKIFRGRAGATKYANDFSFQFYGAKEPMTEVFPEGGRELSSAIGRTGYSNWRFSKSGPAFLSHYSSQIIFLELPRAEAVMTEWFRERGWSVTLSGPGRIAVQLLKQLGGTFGTSWLAHRGVVDLLGSLEKEAGMPRQAVIGRLKQVIEQDGLFFDADRFLEGLLESNALRLGAKIQCPVCTRHNWYELDGLEYELECRFCLSSYQPPLKSPKQIEWTYRAHGPFVNSIAQGSFTVLLLFKFLGADHDRAITPLFSYTAAKNGRKLEADFTCLYKSSARRDLTTYVLHAECKSFNRFDLDDISRMKLLAQEFPGSGLIFGTLNDSLNPEETEIIKAFALAERDKKLRGKPYSPVIILTGVELFSLHGLSDCWSGKGGLYEEFDKRTFEYAEPELMADATQQLYLGLPSWYEWSEQKTKRKKRNKRVPRHK
tara:strand:+ start:1312 stop:3510 length:2199 start_codon:yes stop_codon:yes gene_type:complete